MISGQWWRGIIDSLQPAAQEARARLKRKLLVRARATAGLIGHRSLVLYAGPLLLLSLLLLLLLYLKPAAPGPEADYEVFIPDQADWIDYGPIFTAGEVGAWDYQLWGGFTNSAVKEGDQYYLYYQGAGDYRIVPDETVLWRAIGVAVSRDGINFVKSKQNPILTWFPSGYPEGNGEEGAVSAGATVDDNGNILLHYGANTATSSTRVHADGRLAVAQDGVAFTDRGIVLDHADRSLWGSGDEIFPVGAIHDAGRWFVYYLPNGGLQARRLGVAWGDDAGNLDHSAMVRSGFHAVKAWGTIGYGEVAPDRYALFLNNVTTGIIEVRLVDLSAPDRVGPPVVSYHFSDTNQATVLLDGEKKTWFMYYRTEDGYGVKVARAGAKDTTPPSPPTVTARPLDHQRIKLRWQGAQDSDTGVALYKLFRDGREVATVKGDTFVDSGLAARTLHHYTVAAVNLHGSEGEKSAAVTARTLPDTTPPAILSANAAGDLHTVTITFDEPVAAGGATARDNYHIAGLSVEQATPGPRGDTVLLTTSAQEPDRVYEVSVRRVRDRACAGNVILPGTAVSFTATPVAGLVGVWHFDKGYGALALDTANYGSNGTLHNVAGSGPSWTRGIAGSALHFDGVDDQVTVPGSATLRAATGGNFAFAAWARPERLPPNTTVNNERFTVMTRAYNGLYYDRRGRYQAQLTLADGTEVTVVSPPVAVGEWHHVLMVVDDNKKTLRLFLDGSEVAASPVSYDGTLAIAANEPYYIGASDPLPQRYAYRFQGSIDEVRIYKQSTVDPLLVAGMPAQP